MQSPSLTEIRFLESAARNGSFSAAARELAVSQQGVSSGVRGFERRTGLRLLDRSPAGVTPTPAGDAVIAWGRDVLAAADRMDEGIASLTGRSPRSMTVGASQTIAAHLLPGWLIALRRDQHAAGRAPAEFALRTGNSAEVIALVRGGALDLGFIENPGPPQGLGHLVVGTDRLIVAVPDHHAWAGRASIALAELAGTPLVSREIGSGTRAAYDEAVQRELGVQPAAPAIVLATEAAVRSAVIAGVAPAVLSPLTVEDDVRLGRIRALPIEPASVSRSFTAIWRGTRRDLSGARWELVSVATA